MPELNDLHRFEFNAECLKFIDSLLADNKSLFPLTGCVEVQIQRRECQKQLRNIQHPLYSLAEAILQFI
jgi:hypothetical protein